MTPADERAAIVDWLRAEAVRESEAIAGGWPFWLRFLWVLFNRYEFGQMRGALFARVDAANAIERGEHLRGGGE